LHLALVVTLSIVAAPLGCALSETKGGGGAPGQLCKQGDDAACADGNVCHANYCDPDGVCVTANRMGDPPDSKPGDCHRIRCNNGVASLEVDPTDVDDDNNPCTTDTCDNGKPIHTDVKRGTTCKYQGHTGACNGKTDCEIPCQGGNDCTTTDACTIGACDLGTNKCSFMKLNGVSPPGVPPVPGDCLDATCVMGVTKEFANPDDLPTVAQCDKPLCVDSGDPNRPLKPSSAPKMAGAACSMNGASLCDGMGNCVFCINDGDCTSDGNLCHTPTCNSNGKCTHPNTPAGPSSALASMQVPGDCHQLQCDGMGNIVNVVDQTDPTNGGNPCLNYFCDAGGTNQTSHKMDGLACGGGLSCSAGVCSGCTTNGMCPNHPLERCDAPNCDCPGNGLQLETCASQGLTCGTINDTGCGAALGCNNGKDGLETDTDCGGPAANCPTRCPQGSKCNVSSDCAGGRACVDGYCCESACGGGCFACSQALNGVGNGLCRAIPNNNAAKVGSCALNPPCGNDGLCDGTGACQKSLSGTSCGSTCSSATQSNNTCNGMGTCIPGAGMSCAPYQCANGMTCAMSCSSDAGCTSGNYCYNGVCGSVKPNGDPCGGGPECGTGNCVNNVCCASNSCGPCKTCNGSMPGTCTNLASGDQSGVCDGTHAAGGCGTAPCHCDGGGNCVTGCVGNNDCDICQTCMGGVCTPVAMGQTTAGRCDATNGNCVTTCTSQGATGCGTQCACDGADHCLLATGQECTCDQNCASGSCPGSSDCTNAANHMCM
jgi:hypothetical protein